MGQAYIDREAEEILARLRRETGVSDLTVSQAIRILAERAGTRRPATH